VLIDAAINLVATFYKIHMQGYCFYSLLADFLINPANGKVLFTDTEYLDIEGTQYRVLNKPRYMAPEVVLGNDSYGVTNDRFVLGIYLFMLLCKAHPLEGKRYLVPGWTAGHEKRLYGSEPLFMMDPDDNSNAPHPIIHRDAIALWNQLPGYIRHLFIRTFGQSGLRNPSMRPLEKDWLNALMRYRGEIFQCTCGNEIHVEAGKNCQCDSCNKDICPAYSLEFDEYSIPAIKGYTIYRSQLGICAPYDILQPIGRLVEKKGIPGVLGIRNLTDVKWKAIISDGKIGVVLPNQVIQLEMDMKLEFHGSRLVIKEHKSPHTIG
jgi:DNA-binding helix-hairpin-helix protein with protein kinase domain